jgi:hypothetical protein
MPDARWGLLLLILTNSATGTRADGASAATPRAAQATQVITFRPALPTVRRRGGDCWTESAAVDRPEAWRCAAGNDIYDPCFSLAELKGAVVCGADPARHRRGFALALTKPLPTRSPSQVAEPLPWMLQLADGSICELTTGTSAQVDGQDVPYECSDSRRCTDDCPYLTGVTSNLSRAAVWTADKVAFRSSRRGVKLLKRTSVAVVTAWQ